MKIVIDLQSLQTESGKRGIGRYSLALARAMVAERKEHEWFIALSHAFPESVDAVRQAFTDLLPRENVVLFQVPTPVAELDPRNGWHRQVAELSREYFLQQLRPDWVHLTSLFEGARENAVTSIDLLGHLPTAATLYDLIPYSNPERYLSDPSRKSWYMRKLAYLRRAELLLAISEYSRREAIDSLGVPAERVVNVSTNADPCFRVLKLDQDAVTTFRARYGLSRDFVLFTGVLEYRKNIEGLIEAYACLPAHVRTVHHLVAVGNVENEDRRRLLSMASRFGLRREEVVLTGYVTDEDLVMLYNLCKVFVLPSLQEGFGLPALEAMRCGAAVIASDRTSIPEVVGLDAALFDPASARSISDKLLQVLTDDQFRKRLREHGLAQAGKFSWNATAKRALAAFEALHEQRKHAENSGKEVFPSVARPRLAYVSPLLRELVLAGYSAELLPELARYYEIDLISDSPINYGLGANLRRRSVAEFGRCGREYDRILYHIGNFDSCTAMFPMLAKHPGTVILHDFFLNGVLNGLEVTTPASTVRGQAIYRSLGYRALRDWQRKGPEEAESIFLGCLDILQGAQGVIVSSEDSVRFAERFFSFQTEGRLVKIPPLRHLPRQPDRMASRQVLGLPEDALVVCSFGVLAANQPDDILLNAWLSSDLLRGCYLICVGGIQESECGKLFRQCIDALDCTDRIKITGPIEPSTYEHYLAAADVAVYLPSNSRRQTVRAVFECLAYGVAIVVGKHGALAELPPGVVVTLPEQFTASDLATVLEQLVREPALREEMRYAGRQYVQAELDPAPIARRYVQAIETFASNHPVALQRRLLSAIAALPGDHVRVEGELSQAAETIAENTLSTRARKLLVDVSELVHRDARTGIQRVVGSILRELLMEATPGYRVEPVYRTDGLYRYARRFTEAFLGIGTCGLEDTPVDVMPQDVFLGLDLDACMDEAARGWLNHHGRRSMQRYFVVYDLLPLLRPDCFPSSLCRDFASWLTGLAAMADGLICISRAVAIELGQWLDKHPVSRQRPLSIGFFHLGSDMEVSHLDTELSEPEAALLAQLAGRTTILMVGTVEPRKGYAQALKAFEKLWAGGSGTVLLIVGKEGWQMNRLARLLRTHTESQRRLFWLGQASDVLLLELYRSASALLMASEGEGFGLPLVEAGRHGLPLIVRDLPVFREVVGDNAFYFHGADPDALTDALQTWLGLYQRSEHPCSRGIRWLRWGESAQQLKDVLLDGRWYAEWGPDRGFCCHTGDSIGGEIPGIVPAGGDERRRVHGTEGGATCL